MNDIEDALVATLARRAAAVPASIGLPEEIRRRHAVQRRRRTLVGAASGIAAVTIIGAGVTTVGLPSSGDTPARLTAAADPSPSADAGSPSSASGGVLPWPARGNLADDAGARPTVGKLRLTWAEAPGSSVRAGKDIAPLGASPRLLGVLHAAVTPSGNVLVLQGTDATKRAMLAVFEVTDTVKLISRAPVEKYRVSPSADVLRFVIDDRVLLLTPPKATAGVSKTPAGDGTPVFTPIPLDDGMLTQPLEGGPWAQVQVRVGSTIVYQGPISPS